MKLPSTRCSLTPRKGSFIIPDRVYGGGRYGGADTPRVRATDGQSERDPTTWPPINRPRKEGGIRALLSSNLQKTWSSCFKIQTIIFGITHTHTHAHTDARAVSQLCT